MNKGTLIVNGIDYSNGGGASKELVDKVEQNTSDIANLNGNISNKVDRRGDTMTGLLKVPVIADVDDYNNLTMSNENVEVHVYADGGGFEIYGYPNQGGFEGLILKIAPDDRNVGAVVTNGIGKISILAPNGLLLNGFELKKTVPADAKFTDTTYNDATQTSSGLMSANDKKKLDTMVTGSTTKIREFTFHWDSMYIKSNGGNPMINYSNELMSVTNVKNYWFEIEDAWPLENWNNGACVFIQSVYRDSLNFVLGTTQSQSYRCTVRMFVVYEE